MSTEGGGLSGGGGGLSGGGGGLPREGICLERGSAETLWVCLGGRRGRRVCLGGSA